MKKNKIKKIISILAISCLTLSFIGCGQTSKKETSKIEKIKEKGTIVLGTSADYPPYEFHKNINGKDTIVGFDIDIAKEISKDLGVKLEIKDMKFDGLLAALDAGNIDFVISGMTPTEERAKNVDFSKVYYKANQGIIVRAGDENKYNSVNDLKGLNIGAQKGSIQEDIAKKQIPNSNVKSLPKVTDLVLALTNKKIDAIVMEEPVAKAYVSNNKSLALTKVEVEDKEGGSAIAAKKGSTDLIKAINATIDKLNKSNKINEFVVEANKLSE
ncbi:ABC transporter substrate-binding protein [Haloimpatiens sp. FM7330]|uniref:ABC transporter substrate-binding protein n=1 Tax=Haloimpatiens sp. FM7330 TaxID=3298610 RepID=UPI00362D15F9